MDLSCSSDAALVCAGGKLNSERKTVEEMGLKHVRRQNKRHRAELHTWGGCFWLPPCSLGLTTAWHGAGWKGSRAVEQKFWPFVKNFKVWIFASILLGLAWGLFFVVLWWCCCVLVLFLVVFLLLYGFFCAF